MSLTVAVQGTPVSFVVYLELQSDGTAATGLTFSDVACYLKKDSGSFAPKTLDGTNFTEIGSGFYELDLAASDTDTVGNLYVRVQGGTIRATVGVVYVTSTTPVTTSATAQSISTTSLFGYIYDSAGAPVSGAAISARILSSPLLLHPGDDGVAITTGLTTVKSDGDGFFALSLVSGTVVDIIIPTVNYRRTVTVPSSSANLFDIP